MAQYVYTMNRVGKIVPPKRVILKDISLSFFPGAKIGVLGLNGSGKSTLLRIMAGVDREYEGEATPMPGLRIGYLPQEPQLDPTLTLLGRGQRQADVAVAGHGERPQVADRRLQRGADGGAVAGHQVEKEVKKKKYWSVSVRMDDGSVRNLTYSERPPANEGERVKLLDGGRRMALVAN